MVDVDDIDELDNVDDMNMDACCFPAFCPVLLQNPASYHSLSLPGKGICLRRS